jgi:hypothetical protein
MLTPKRIADLRKLLESPKLSEKHARQIRDELGETETEPIKVLFLGTLKITSAEIGEFLKTSGGVRTLQDEEAQILVVGRNPSLKRMSLLENKIPVVQEAEFFVGGVTCQKYL